MACVHGLTALVLLPALPLSLALNDNQFLGIVFWYGITTVLALGIPIASGFAILRYRLYDLDIVVKKTVVFGALAGFATLVYLAVVVGIGAAIGDRGNSALTLAAAAIIAIAFQPLRLQARRFADHLVYGERATPYEVLSDFSDRMSAGYSIDEVLPRMVQILAEGTGAARASVWLRVSDEARSAATWPTDTSEDAVSIALHDLEQLPDVDRSFPVRHSGELLGALGVSMPAAEPLTPPQERLVADLASQAGLILRNVRLIEELRASRQRLVSAQDGERRRIERNIHDGAQQQLVAMAVKLNMVRRVAAKDPDKADTMLMQLQSDVQNALEDLRDLARGIFPPLLAEQGLGAALEAQAARSPVPVTVETNGVGRYSQDVEAAVYFCSLEALQNVAKYAEATQARLRLSQQNGVLHFQVEDDGRGFDSARTGYGTGLQGMVDRIEALGGVVTVNSAIGSGTTIEGEIRVLTEDLVQRGHRP
jgi:signal transduction histidine kinase